MHNTSDTSPALSAALEDYLNAIYRLSSVCSAVRITDIANYLNLSKPSANRAVNTLKLYGLVTHRPYKNILLTDKGKAHADMIYHKHILIKRFLVDILSVEESYADRDANLMKHGVSRQTLEKLAEFMNIVSHTEVIPDEKKDCRSQIK